MSGQLLDKSVFTHKNLIIKTHCLTGVPEIQLSTKLPFVEDFVMRPTGERPGKGAGGTTPRATGKYLMNSKHIVIEVSYIMLRYNKVVISMYIMLM